MKKRPGHLKERNHFDEKDIILLVVTMLIIYGIMTWLTFGRNPSDFQQNTGNPTATESTQEVSSTPDET